MDFPNQPRGDWHLLRVGVFLVALLLLLQSGSVRGEADQTPNEWKIESVLEHKRGPIGKGGGGCEEQYGIMPCSVSLGGNAALLVTYGYMLYNAAMLLSEGSELLLTVMSPGIVGGFVLPILDTLPDAVLIAASGLGGSNAEAQEEVLVGMGLLAGSSVLMLTALWGLCLISGRCDLVPHERSGALVAKDRTLTKGFSLTETGVTNDHQTRWASWIMMATLLPFLVAQIPRVFGLDTEGHYLIAIAAAIAVLELFAFCAFQLVFPWFQERKIIWAKARYRRNHALHKVSHLTNEQNWGSLFTPEDEPNEEVLKRLFDHFDPDNDHFLTEAELKGLILGLGIERHNGQVPGEDELKHWMKEFDISGDGQISQKEFLAGIKRWMKISASSFKKRKSASSSAISCPSEHYDWDIAARNATLDIATLEPLEDDDDEENKTPPSRQQIIGKAVGYLISGSLVAAIFADPLVNAILGLSKASGKSPFMVSFVATPLATSFKAALHFRVSLVSFVATPIATSFRDAVHFQASTKKRRKRNISMAYSQIYGALTMKNTMGLGVFLAIVYFRHLVWDFSAEVSVVLFATLIMGSLAAVRTTFPLWMGFFALALYPLSIGLVVYLENVWGWR